MLQHLPSNQPTQCSDLFQQLELLLQGLLIQDVQELVAVIPLHSHLVLLLFQQLQGIFL